MSITKVITLQQYIKEKQLDHLTGMRAYLGVFPVIIFHIYPNLVPGGFLGVDIFFVISGFLIVKILSEQNLRLVYKELCLNMKNYHINHL